MALVCFDFSTYMLSDLSVVAEPPERTRLKDVRQSTQRTGHNQSLTAEVGFGRERSLACSIDN